MAPAKIKKSERNSSIELLRIIAMLCIVCHHFVVYGNFEFEKISFGINKFMLDNLALGKLGVNIFIIISGYYLIKSNLHKEKIVRLILDVQFYALVMYSFCVAAGVEEFSSNSLFHSFTTIIYGEYWFFTAYIVLFLIAPYINILLNNLTRGQHLKLILILVFLSCFISDFMYGKVYINQLGVFIMLYCIGAFIRLYPEGILDKKYIGVLCVFSSMFMFVLFNLSKELAGIKGEYHYASQHILILAWSIGMFIMFLQITIPCSKIINTISSATFGIYLIHDNPHMRSFLWETVFKNAEYTYSKLFPVHMIKSVLTVFVICLIIELLRKAVIHILTLCISSIKNFIKKDCKKNLSQHALQ